MVTTTFADGPNDEDGGLIEIAIKIPAGRLADFYRMLGQWMAGAVVGGDEASERDILPWSPYHDQKLAMAVLSKMTPPARKLFEILASNPDTRYGADELAEIAGIANGRYGIAGVLAWPSRYFARECRRPLPIEIEPRNGGSIYWMKADIAGLMLTALRGEVPPAAQR